MHTHSDNKPYDRHYYKVDLQGESYTFEDYEEVKQFCYHTDAVVSIIDYNTDTLRPSGGQGF